MAWNDWMSRDVKIKVQNMIHELRPHKPRGEKIGQWNGHNFWEYIEPDRPVDVFPRRYIEYKDDIPVPHLLPELWNLWLRNSIDTPPTDEELGQYDERKRRYMERIAMDKARDEKKRLEEQLQRKVASELAEDDRGQNGSTNSTEQKVDPMESVRDFVQQMEVDLHSRREHHDFAAKVDKEMKEALRKNGHGPGQRRGGYQQQQAQQQRGSDPFGGNFGSNSSTSPSGDQNSETNSWDPTKKRNFDF
jgi:NADH:ubiquinone oxidoreductase subunit